MTNTAIYDIIIIIYTICSVETSTFCQTRRQKVTNTFVGSVFFHAFYLQSIRFFNVCRTRMKLTDNSRLNWSTAVVNVRIFFQCWNAFLRRKGNSWQTYNKRNVIFLLDLQTISNAPRYSFSINQFFVVKNILRNWVPYKSKIQ